MTKHPGPVLLIDDDKDLLAVIASRIESELGMRTLTACNALTALAQLGCSPSLVVCDVKMPTANGLDICEMLDADPQFQETPVIVMTGCSDGHTLRRVADRGFRYVHKGVNAWRQLRPAIREHFAAVEPPAAGAVDSYGAQFEID